MACIRKQMACIRNKWLNKIVSWDFHIEDKVSKNVEILHKAEHALNKIDLKSLHLAFFSLIFRLWKYCMWEYKQNQTLEKMASKQKQAAGVIINNVALDINDKMEDNILKRLQTEYLFINHICFALVKELFL